MNQLSKIQHPLRLPPRDVFPGSEPRPDEGTLPYEPRFDDHISGKIDPLLTESGKTRIDLPSKRVETLRLLSHPPFEENTKRGGKPKTMGKVALAVAITLGAGAATNGFDGVPVLKQTTNGIKEVVEYIKESPDRVVDNVERRTGGDELPDERLDVQP